MKKPITTKHLGFGTDESEEADYNKMKDSVMEEVKRIFKPEFINRIDEVLVFHMLTKDDLKEIVKIFLKSLDKRTNAQMHIKLDVSESAIEHIAESGFDKNYGARPIRRAIQTQIEDLLADKLLSDEIKAGDDVVVDYDKDAKKITIAVK